jgi:hypothetical protein
MKRKIFLLVAALATLLLTGCDKIRQIKVTGCSLVSFTPTGMRSANAELALAIENPAMQFTLEDIVGTVYRNGNVFGTFSADPITVRAKTAAVYPLNCSAALSSEVSLGEILKLARSYDLAEFTVDVEALIRLKSGIAKRFKLKDLNVKEMLE